MGDGTGALTMTEGASLGSITIDASTFDGRVNLTDMSASGNISVSMGTFGHVSSDGIGTTGSLLIDGGAATTGQVTLATVSASGATISMGAGSGNFVVTSEIASEAGFLFDGTGGYHGLVNFNAITASGTATLSVGDSVFTAQNVQVAGSFTFDKSTSTTGNATITNLSADSISITMGGGSADLVIAGAAAGGMWQLMFLTS